MGVQLATLFHGHTGQVCISYQVSKVSCWISFLDVSANSYLPLCLDMIKYISNTTWTLGYASLHDTVNPELPVYSAQIINKVCEQTHVLYEPLMAIHNRPDIQ